MDIVDGESGAFEHRRTTYFDDAFPGLNDLLLVQGINSRTILEDLPTDNQCLFTIGDSASTDNCWLCGLRLGDNDIECEHVLPILTAYLVFGGLAEGVGTAEEFDIKKMEYRWAHKVCNRTKSDNIFMLDQKPDSDNILSFLTRLSSKKGPFKNELDSAKTDIAKNLIRKKAYDSIISVITPIIQYWNYPSQLNLLAGVAAVEYKLKEVADKGNRAGLIIRNYLSVRANGRANDNREIRNHFRVAQVLSTVNPITKEDRELGYISAWINAYPTLFVSRTNELRIDTSAKKLVEEFTIYLFSTQIYTDYLGNLRQNIPKMLNFVRVVFLDGSRQHDNLGKFTLVLDTLLLFNAKRTTNNPFILSLLNAAIDDNRTISVLTEIDQQYLSWFDVAVAFMLDKTIQNGLSLMADTIFSGVQITPQMYQQLNASWIDPTMIAAKTGGRSGRAHKTRRVKRNRRKTKRAFNYKNK